MLLESQNQAFQPALQAPFAKVTPPKFAQVFSTGCLFACVQFRFKHLYIQYVFEMLTLSKKSAGSDLLEANRMSSLRRELKDRGTKTACFSKRLNQGAALNINNESFELLYNSKIFKLGSRLKIYTWKCVCYVPFKLQTLFLCVRSSIHILIIKPIFLF